MLNNLDHLFLGMFIDSGHTDKSDDITYECDIFLLLMSVAHLKILGGDFSFFG